MDWLDWDEPRLERSRTIDIFRDAFAACKWGLIGAPIAALVSISLFLALTPPQYSAEAQLLIDGVSNPAGREHSAGGFDAVKREARLVASRDLVRRAVEELGIAARPEFNAPADGALGPISRALVSMGLTGAPARMGAEERILKSYEDRLTVRAAPDTGLIGIAFRSKDPRFAADAANRIAELYLETRFDFDPRIAGNSIARMAARATTPQRAEFPSGILLFATGGGAAFAAILGALISSAVWRNAARSIAPIEEPMTLPLALGQTDAFIRLKEAARPSPQIRGGAAPHPVESENAQTLVGIGRRILSARRPGNGVRIVGARLAAAQAAPDVMLALGRLLAREGRSIAVSLNTREAEALPECGEPGLSDLLSGTASFDEVIRRDPESRLHFVPAGVAGPIDLCELGRILDALARTYDFIWLLAPPFDTDDMAKTLAATADFVVLAAAPEPNEDAVRQAEAELIGCGAGDVLVIGAPIRFHPSFGQDAA
jgi:hypothetical protein